VTNIRSEDWAVRPSFVPNGPTSPVVLLTDDTGLTQLAGIPAVAWQTPWSEIANIELVRLHHQMALFATVGGVRYCWRNKEITDFDMMRTVVLEHGGVITQRRRRAGIFAVVAVVVIASFAGGVAAWFNRTSGGAQELSNARKVNLTAKDVPATWTKTSQTALSYLVPPSNQVFTSTTTTAPAKKNVSFDDAAHLFQSCIGVSNALDRVYGAAGQQPNYQVSSPIFVTSSLGGIEVASTSQYYQTTTMVNKDTAEMSKANFGTCFAESSASLILSGYSQPTPSTFTASNWSPATFTKGFARGGVVTVSLPMLGAPLQLVMVLITHGHYEVTLSALVGSFTKAKSELTTLANTLLARTTSSTAEAA
jgi:hypothetical protein